MGFRSGVSRRVRNVLLAVAIIGAQFTAIPIANLTGVAHAAPLCTNDLQGANDEPGQKDLTRMCVDAQPSPVITWQWDDTSWPGGNTGDACSLFDTNNNGLVDKAICVTVGGNPAVQQANSPRIYSCGDTKPQTCTSSVLLAGPYVTTCSVTTNGDDPFNASFDTLATCTVNLTEVGGGVLLDVCSYPSQVPNSDFSDCIVYRSNSAKIEVRKVLSPADDSGLFDLKINGATYADNVGNNGTTGEVVVDSGSVTVLEAENAPTDLAQYSTTVVCRNLNGTGAIVAQASPTGADTRQLAFTAPNESDIVCIFTNTRQNGSLTVVKNLIKDNGATQSVTDFGFQVDGGSVIPFEADASNTISYPVGTVIGAVTEPAVAGFATSYSNCSNITIVAGQTQTCTITNNDVAPQLTVIKHVVNDNGGSTVAADFDMQVTGTNVSDSSFPGVEDPGTTVTLNAGAYSVAESGPGGYGASLSPSCAGTIAIGEHKTCTITNNDIAPALTIVKNVVNDNGGTASADDFTLRINAAALISPVLSNGDTTATYTLANPLAHTSYTVSEDASTGYTGSAVSCIDNYNQAIMSNPVSLSEGQSVTCTITNNDNTPALTLIKNLVDNYQSGAASTDWTLTANGPTTLSGTTGVTSGSSFDAGIYDLSESGPSTGFTASAWDCGPNATISGATLTIALGETVICTITNTAIQPKITLIKEIDGNQYGDTSTVNDFGLTIGGVAATSGTAYGQNVGSYVINEAGKSGYNFVSITGDAKCPDTLGGSVNVVLGDDITCTIHNEAIAPVLKLKKIAINDNGGTTLSGDFSLYADANQFTGGDSVVDLGDSTITTTIYTTGLGVGSYNLSETAVLGYSSTGWSCTSGLDGSVVYVTLGSDITCTITNNDNTPALTLVKSVVNNYSAGTPATDWTLTADGPTTISGAGGATSDANFKAGDYNLSESGPTDGFHASSWDCGDGAALSEATLTIGLGETVICTITNTAIQPKVKVIKHVVDEFGGSKVASDFTMTVTGTDVTLTPGNSGTAPSQDFAGSESGTYAYLDAGNYSVDETEISGYTKSLSSDCSGTIALGEEKVCTITNTAEQPKINLVKEFVGGEGDQNDFTPLLNDQDASWGENLVDAGDYTVDEKTPMLEGYKLHDIVCYMTGTENLVASPFKLNVGEDVTCVVTNEKLGSVVVTKYNDLNRNGVRDEYFGNLEPVVEGITINLNGDSAVTDANGNVSFTNLSSDEYDLSESLPEGWMLTNISCQSDKEYEGYFYNGVHKIYLGYGENVTCEIGNARTDVNLDIVKTNNASTEKSRGDIVTYTLTLSNPIDSGLLVNPTIVDTPPTGFTYQTGSTTATSSYRGDLKAQSIVGEPTVNSTLTWTLDGVLSSDDVLYPGEVITITYTMKIGQGVMAGVKTNTAVGSACSAPTVRDQEIYLERAESLLQIAVPEQDCVMDESSSNVTVKVPVALVDTGSPIELGVVAGSLLILGALLVSNKKFTRR